MYLRSDNFHLIKLILCVDWWENGKKWQQFVRPKIRLCGFLWLTPTVLDRQTDRHRHPPPHTIWTGIHFCCTVCWEWFHLCDFCCWEWIKSNYRLAIIFCFQSASGGKKRTRFPIDYRMDLLRHGNNKSKKINSLNNSLNANDSPQNCKQYLFTKFCICISQVVFIFSTIFKEMLNSPPPKKKNCSDK